MQSTIYGMTHVYSVWMWYMVFHIIDGTYMMSLPVYICLWTTIYGMTNVYSVYASSTLQMHIVCVCCSSFDSIVRVAGTTANASHIHIDK